MSRFRKALATGLIGGLAALTAFGCGANRAQFSPVREEVKPVVIEGTTNIYPDETSVRIHDDKRGLTIKADSYFETFEIIKKWNQTFQKVYYDVNKTEREKRDNFFVRICAEDKAKFGFTDSLYEGTDSINVELNEGDYEIKSAEIIGKGLDCYFSTPFCDGNSTETSVMLDIAGKRENNCGRYKKYYPNIVEVTTLCSVKLTKNDKAKMREIALQREIQAKEERGRIQERERLVRLEGIVGRVINEHVQTLLIRVVDQESGVELPETEVRIISDRNLESPWEKLKDEGFTWGDYTLIEDMVDEYSYGGDSSVAFVGNSGDVRLSVFVPGKYTIKAIKRGYGKVVDTQTIKSDDLSRDVEMLEKGTKIRLTNPFGKGNIK